MLTSEEATRRVARGAAHLDQVKPGWWNQIDVGTLTLSSCERCVIGQLAGPREMYPFSAGLRAMGLIDAAANHGVSLTTGDYPDDPLPDDFEAAFARLQAAWIAAIADRRLAQGDNELTRQPDDVRGTEGAGDRFDFLFAHD